MRNRLAGVARRRHEGPHTIVALRTLWASPAEAAVWSISQARNVCVSETVSMATWEPIRSRRACNGYDWNAPLCNDINQYSNVYLRDSDMQSLSNERDQIFKQQQSTSDNKHAGNISVATACQSHQARVATFGLTAISGVISAPGAVMPNRSHRRKRATVDDACSHLLSTTRGQFSNWSSTLLEQHSWLCCIYNQILAKMPGAGTFSAYTPPRASLT